MPQDQQPIVVVGGGLAGGKAVEQLREAGYDGPLVLVSAEPHLPYERPPLSKDFLMGKAERDVVFVHPRAWYVEHDVELVLGEQVDCAGRRGAPGADGVRRRVGYAQAAAGPGCAAAPARPARPGRRARRAGAVAAHPGRLRAAARLAAPGHAAGRGRRWLDRPGGGGRGPPGRGRRDGARAGSRSAATGPGSAGGDGVRRQAPRRGRRPARRGVGRAGSSRTATGCGSGSSGGDDVPADVVLVGDRGDARGSGWPRRPGWSVDNGIVTDAQLRTSDPDVFACGDVGQRAVPGARSAGAGRALGVRAEPAGDRGPRDARRRRDLRPAALLLHRPVRPRAWSTTGSPTRRQPAARRPRRPGRRRVRRGLAGRRRRGHRRHARQPVGRRGRGEGAGRHPRWTTRRFTRHRARRWADAGAGSADAQAGASPTSWISPRTAYSSGKNVSSSARRRNGTPLTTRRCPAWSR